MEKRARMCYNAHIRLKMDFAAERGRCRVLDITSLRERLKNAAKNVSGGEKAPQRPAAGLEIREYCEKADERLYALPQNALGRIGCTLPHLDIERALFLDTETTGLSGGVGTVAFLVGLGWIRDGMFYVRQILMKDYASEEMLVDELLRVSEGFESTVSFNGKTFDLPLLETRCTMCRKRTPYAKMECIDLLTPARRLWKRRLGSVRLSHLEEEILGRAREDDLPGSEAPQRYFDYLKTGDMALLEDVIEHNRQDILSMGALLVEICDAYANPRQRRETADLLSLGLALGRQGEKEEAEALYRMAARPMPAASLRSITESGYRALAGRELNALLRRQGRFEEQKELLERMRAGGEAGAWTLIELAKIYEHREKDAEVALQYAQRAMQLTKDEVQREEVRRRIARLNAKIAKKNKGETKKCL